MQTLNPSNIRQSAFDTCDVLMPYTPCEPWLICVRWISHLNLPEGVVCVGNEETILNRQEIDAIYRSAHSVYSTMIESIDERFRRNPIIQDIALESALESLDMLCRNDLAFLALD